MGRLTDSPRWMLKELLEACTCRICVICSYVRCKVVVNGICEGVGCRVGGSRDKTEGRRWSWLKGAYTDARSRLVQYTISRDRGVLPKLKRWTFFRSLRSFRRPKSETSKLQQEEYEPHIYVSRSYVHVNSRQHAIQSLSRFERVSWQLVRLRSEIVDTPSTYDKSHR